MDNKFMPDILKLEQALSSALRRGDSKTAQLLCRRIISENSEHHYSLFILATAELKNKNYVAASSYLQKAITSDPDIVIYQVNYAKCLMYQGLRKQMTSVVKGIQWQKIENIEVMCSVGQLHSHLEMHEQAELIFRKALTLNDKSLVLLFNLATTQKYLAKFSSAEQNFEKVLELNPFYAPAHYALATFSKKEGRESRIERIEYALKRIESNTITCSQLYFALYLEYEALCNYSKAFDSLKLANKIYSEKLNYDFNREQQIFKVIKESFTKEGTSKSDSNELVLILGMPRSGTTLMDRILSSHSKVESVGEINYFNGGVFTNYEDLAILNNGRLNISDFGANDFALAGENYLELVGNGTDGKQIYLDKSLTNFLYLGCILKALPNTRVICMRRATPDNCFSNFRQLFSQHTYKYDYSYDLTTTLQYHSEFEQLMSFWKQHYPNNIIDVKYEGLVSDFSSQLERVLEFCGLEHENSCSEFYKNKKSVSTASFSQVRKPLTKHYSGRWERYREFLEKNEFFAHLVKES